jgi:hypothetical protein
MCCRRKHIRRYFKGKKRILSTSFKTIRLMFEARHTLWSIYFVDVLKLALDLRAAVGHRWRVSHNRHSISKKHRHLTETHILCMSKSLQVFVIAHCLNAVYLSGFSTNRKLRMCALCDEACWRLRGTRAFAGRFRNFVMKVSGLLKCYSMWVSKFFQVLRRRVVPWCSGSRFVFLQVQAPRSFDTSRIRYPLTRRSSCAFGRDV